MLKYETILCIGCPLGCSIRLTLDNQGNVIKVVGNSCKQGEKFALDELKNPVRVLTTTVLTKHKFRRLLPVKTNKPINKKLLRQGMFVLAKVRAKLPVKIGNVIVSNLLDAEVNVIATRDLLTENENKS